MNNNIVSQKIQSILTTKGISIEQLSEQSTLSVTQINHVLESDSIPSLAALIKIARALGVRLGTFLDDAEHLGPIVQRKNETQKPASFSSQLSTDNSHLDFFSLAGNKSGRHMEPFIIDIKPSLSSHPILSAHEGEEFIYVMKGSVKINYGKETHILQAGDSIYYDSIVEHLVSAMDNEPSQILAVVYTPL